MLHLAAGCDGLTPRRRIHALIVSANAAPASMAAIIAASALRFSSVLFYPRGGAPLLTGSKTGVGSQRRPAGASWGHSCGREGGWASDVRDLGRKRVSQGGRTLIHGVKNGG